MSATKNVSIQEMFDAKQPQFDSFSLFNPLKQSKEETDPFTKLFTEFYVFPDNPTEICIDPTTQKAKI